MSKIIYKAPPIIAPKIHYPVGKENEYKGVLLGYNASIKKDIRSDVIPRVTKVGLPSLYNLDLDDDLDGILDDIALNTSTKTLATERLMKAIGLRTIQSVSGDMRAAVGANIVRIAPNLGVNIFSDPSKNLVKLTRAWTSTNSRLIKSIPVELLDNVSRVINAGFRNGSSIKTIKEQLKMQFKISDNRARLIARDQIAKLSSNVVQQESQELGYDLYVWVTSRDGDRVRKSHRVMEGKICSWNDPTIYKNNLQEKRWRKRSSIGGVELNIGQDFQCRCSPRVILTPR